MVYSKIRFFKTDLRFLIYSDIRCGYTRPLAKGEPWGYDLGWVYPGLCSTPRLRLHACKLPKGMVSVDLFWRET